VTPLEDTTGATRLARDDTGVVATPADWAILRRELEWGRSQRLDTLPVGEAVARMGLSFVGTPYRPGTLEVEGPERLVVNLRELDCVTFVETTLALTHLVRDSRVPVPSATDAPGMEALEAAYRKELTRIRYRGGILNGYPSRLHYFSEWIRDAEKKGILRDVTTELGGVEDREPVVFMSQHPDAYARLSDPGVLAAIERTETRISRVPRVYIPQDRIAAVARGVHDGDVIAATSSVPGLDVAHTGIAYRKDGSLHLIHAPLVGDSVHVSVRTLAQRVNDIEGQDGIIVARPAEGL